MGGLAHRERVGIYLVVGTICGLNSLGSPEFNNQVQDIMFLTLAVSLPIGLRYITAHKIFENLGAFYSKETSPKDNILEEIVDATSLYASMTAAYYCTRALGLDHHFY